jgi:phosphohistidine phosphatase
MARERLRPDLALVSPALRARETWPLVAAAFPKPPPHRTEPRLYMATDEGLLDFVRAADERAATLLLLGHNPGLEEFADLLIGRGHRDARKRLGAKFPTAALAVIDFTIDDWTELQPHEGTLVHFITPRSLGAQRD